MAVPATTVWEIRSGATAGNLNGGGFDPANSVGNTTDYSQQASAQYGFSDLSTTNGTSNPPTVHSASHAFTNSDVGNFMKIASGGTFTPGWYCINSLSGSDAVLDRACSSGASTSGGVYKVGGAISLATSGTHSDDAFFETAQPGNTFYVQNGTYAITNISLSAVGTAALPINVIGYNSSRTDAPTDDNRPLFGSATNANNFALSAYWNVSYMRFQGTGTQIPLISTNGVAYYCKAINTSSTADRPAFSMSGNASIAINCEGISYRGRGFTLGNNAQLINCYAHDSKDGIVMTNTSGVCAVIGCIIASNINSGITLAANITGIPQLILNNTFYGSEVQIGKGIDAPTGSIANRIVNNIFYGLTTGINHADNVKVTYSNFNTFYNNGTDVTNVTKGANDIALNPQFKNVSQLTGSTATTSGSVLTQSGGDFSSVTDGVDFLYLISGTGTTNGITYRILSHTSTTVTLDIAPGTSATADKVWSICIGHQFEVSSNMKAAANPLPDYFAGGLTKSYVDIGAIQRKEPIGPNALVGNVKIK